MSNEIADFQIEELKEIIKGEIQKALDYLTEVNADYLSRHLICKHHCIDVWKPDPADRWVADCYDLSWGEETGILTPNKNGILFPHIKGTLIVDSYLEYLSHKYSIEFDEYDVHFKGEEATAFRLEKENEWKKEIVTVYDSEAHLFHVLRNIFTEHYWDFARNNAAQILSAYINTTASVIFGRCIDINAFNLHGLSFKIISDEPAGVAIRGKSAPGVFDYCTRYGRIEQLNKDATTLNIPHKIEIDRTYYVQGVLDNSFDNLETVKKIIFPPSIKNIEWSFWRCTNLEWIEVNSSAYKSVDGVLYSADLKTLIAFPPGRKGSYTVLDNVSTIAPKAFKDCSMVDELYLPATVKKIGINAFYGCKNLTKINSNANIAFQYDGTFGCPSYSKINPRVYFHGWSCQLEDIQSQN